MIIGTPENKAPLLHRRKYESGVDFYNRQHSVFLLLLADFAWAIGFTCARTKFSASTITRRG